MAFFARRWLRVQAARLGPALIGGPSSLLFLWLSIAAVLLVVARSNVFAGPTYEWSDFAANALQIDRAKHLSELLGNYSRFGFHHPGPAFFYVYAAGEAIFFDALHLVAAPANAHLLASIILQAAFMATSLTALSSVLPAVHRGSFLLAAGSLAILVFGLAQQPELNIWPPYVLVWPFLAFLSCAIAVAAGDSWQLFEPEFGAQPVRLRLEAHLHAVSDPEHEHQHAAHHDLCGRTGGIGNCISSNG